MDLTEATNAMYSSCVEAGACTEPSIKKSYTRDAYYGNSTYDDYPVISVSWEQARGYCEWWGARLPSEAEWEKAARGTDGRLYPWGNTYNGKLANFCDKSCPVIHANKEYDDGYEDTAPVGSYHSGVSPYDLFDMAGNVWEWVMDWYSASYYAGLPFRNPTGPSSGEARVLRGGAWDGGGDFLRVAYRDGGDPSASYNSLGFRCARSP